MRLLPRPATVTSAALSLGFLASSSSSSGGTTTVIGRSSALLLPPHPSSSVVTAGPYRRSSSLSMSTSTSTTNESGAKAGPYTYRYPRPSVTVDAVVFTADPSERPAPAVRLLLIKRGNDPFKGRYALPGGFVDPDEDLEAAAKRELEEETGFVDVTLAQVGAFGKPGRDPRGHTITVAYTAFVLLGATERAAAVKAGDDAAEAGWFDLGKLPPLAFDHAEVVRAAWGRLRMKEGGEEVWESGSGRVLAECGDGAAGRAVAALVEGAVVRVEGEGEGEEGR